MRHSIEHKDRIYVKGYWFLSFSKNLYKRWCIHTVKGIITITRAGADAAARQADERNKRVIFKNCAPFINCKTEINNTEIDNAKDIDIVIPIYNWIEYGNNYSKKIWKFMAILQK